MKTFVNWILTKLNEKDWRQADLAREAGISTGALSNILNRNRMPGPDTVKALANALGEPPEIPYRLLGWLDQPFDLSDPALEEIYEFAKQLTPDERRRLARVARLYLQEQQERYETGKKKEAGSSAESSVLRQ